MNYEIYNRFLLRNCALCHNFRNVYVFDTTKTHAECCDYQPLGGPATGYLDITGYFNFIHEHSDLLALWSGAVGADDLDPSPCHSQLYS